MPRKPSKVPTDAELAILRVLWEQGPSTVLEVQQALGRSRPMGYTTVLKFLQIMTVKELVACDKSRRTHIYAAASSEGQTQRRLVKNLLDRAFGGCAQKLVMHALAAARSSPEEIAEIRKLIDEKRGV